MMQGKKCSDDSISEVCAIKEQLPPCNIMYSFIVPVYNSETYLAQCLDSILKQNTKFLFEIILIDDGSTDRTGEIAEGYARKNRNIVLIHKENGGASAARNIGYRESHGKWLTFVDSDDYLADDFLEQIDPLILNLKKDEIIIVDTRHLYDDGTDYVENGVKSKCRRIGNIMNDIQPMNCGKIISRELILENNLFFRERIYYEDMEMFPLIATHLTRYISLEKPLYIYRQRTGSISHDRNLVKMQDSIIAMESCRRRLSSAGELKKCFPEFEFYVITFMITFICAEIIEIDPKHVTARNILRYMEKTFPNYKNNKYISTMSFRNRGYLWLISHKKFAALHRLIRLKKCLKQKLDSGCFRKLYFVYKDWAV